MHPPDLLLKLYLVMILNIESNAKLLQDLSGNKFTVLYLAENISLRLVYLNLELELELEL